MKKEEHSSHGWGIAALVLGIFSFIFAWFPFFGLILAITSLILSMISIVKKSGTEEWAKGVKIHKTNVKKCSLEKVTFMIYLFTPSMLLLKHL